MTRITRNDSASSSGSVFSDTSAGRRAEKYQKTIDTYKGNLHGVEGVPSPRNRGASSPERRALRRQATFLDRKGNPYAFSFGGRTYPVTDTTKKNRWLTAAAVGTAALVGVAAYAYATTETEETRCYKQPNGEAWCTTGSPSADLANAVYEKYVHVPDWAHSGSFVQKTYDQVKGGTEFLLQTAKKVLGVKFFV